MERARLKEPIKWQGHGNINGRLSEGGPCDLTPRTASPERIGETRDPIAPLLGGDGKADGQMCVTIP